MSADEWDKIVAYVCIFGFVIVVLLQLAEVFI
jgi:hypothetical protein